MTYQLFEDVVLTKDISLPTPTTYSAPNAYNTPSTVKHRYSPLQSRHARLHGARTRLRHKKSGGSQIRRQHSPQSRSRQAIQRRNNDKSTPLYHI